MTGVSAGEDRERRRRTIAGAIFVVAFSLVALWVAKAMSDRQTLERCLNSGRRDCLEVPAARDRGYAPVR